MRPVTKLRPVQVWAAATAGWLWLDDERSEAVTDLDYCSLIQELFESQKTFPKMLLVTELRTFQVGEHLSAASFEDVIPDAFFRLLHPTPRLLHWSL